MAQPDALRRIRFWLAVFIIGLVISGITAFPLQTEIGWLVSVLRICSLQPIADSTHLLPWVERVNEGLNLQMPIILFSLTALTGSRSLTWSSPWCSSAPTPILSATNG